MSTAIIFAGADALDAQTQRAAAAQNPGIQRRLAEATEIWRGLTGDPQPLHEFLVSEDSAFHGHFTKKAICCTATQVALFEQTAARGIRADYLLGCSLGDNARTICAGASSFAEGVLGISLFGMRGEEIEGGAILQLAFAQPPTPAELAALEARGLTLAVFQTPSRLLVAGPEEKIQALHADCRATPQVKARILYNKPLHSPWMKPAADHVRLPGFVARAAKWHTPMISTTLNRPIDSAEDLHADIHQNMTGTVYWYQSVQNAVERFQIRRILNIGPARTLLAFLERTPFASPVELVDVPVEAAP